MQNPTIHYHLPHNRVAHLYSLQHLLLKVPFDFCARDIEMKEKNDTMYDNISGINRMCLKYTVKGNAIQLITSTNVVE